MQARTALRRKARGWREGGFLGGTHSVRPKIRAGSKPGHVTVTDGLAIGWWPKRSKVWIGAMSSLRACGARPSAGGKPSMDGPAGETPKMTPREFFRRGLQSLIIPRLFHFGAQDLGFSCLRRPICKFPFWIPGQNSGGSLSPRGARVVPSRSLQPERARDWI